MLLPNILQSVLVKPTFLRLCLGQEKKFLEVVTAVMLLKAAQPKQVFLNVRHQTWPRDTALGEMGGTLRRKSVTLMNYGDSQHTAFN